jgi:hypothetical protein
VQIWCVLDRAAVWLVRVLWLPLPVTAGAAFGDALAASDAAFRTTVSVALWAIWAAILLASLVPHPLTLTAIRVVMPAAPVAIGWALVDTDPTGLGIAGLVSAALAAGTALLAATGDAFVDGASYGAERRFGLRVPVALLMGPLEITWIAVVAGATAGPLLLASGHLLAAGLALLVGLPVVYAGLRAVHGLHRRWLVFVPAGLVVHDLATFDDPLLLARSTIERIGATAPPGRERVPGEPAPALGLALAIELRDAATVAIADRGASALHEVERIVVHPGRPGAVLSEAEQRGLPVT